LEVSVLNSFFSFCILVFSTAAFAGKHDWGGDTVDMKDGTFYAVVENENNKGETYFETVGEPVDSEEEAQEIGDDAAARRNKGKGTTVNQSQTAAQNNNESGGIRIFFGKTKNEDKQRKKIIASSEGDCISNPAGPGCGEFEGKELPSGTKGVKAG
jgi:hypothetical protein